MSRLLEFCLSFPKTLWFNLRHLPLRQAIKLPICVRYDSIVQITKGSICIKGDVRTAMIRIGFHKVPVCSYKDCTQIIIDGGKLVFQGTAHIGHGTKIHVAEGAELVLGDNFAVSASSQINCYHKITMGRDIQFSWDCLVMDSDTHKIYGKNTGMINPDQEVIIGDKVWIGCRTTILKGSVIPDGCVIGAGSLVTGTKFTPDSIIIGSPAKSAKPIDGWEL